MTAWWREWKKSCVYSGRRSHIRLCGAVHPTVAPASTRLCLFSDARFQFSLCISPLYLFTSPLFSAPPVIILPKRKKTPFAAPETLNWLFIDTSCNWLLITVLHHVLIFKSAVSARRNGASSVPRCHSLRMEGNPGKLCWRTQATSGGTRLQTDWHFGLSVAPCDSQQSCDVHTSPGPG